MDNHKAVMTDQLLQTRILFDTKLGLWQIRNNIRTGEKQMFADQTMMELLGADADLSPEACYALWYDNIAEGYRSYVKQAVEAMMSSTQIIEVEYTWRHPVRGTQIVRCVGNYGGQEGDVCIVHGYHRIIGDMVQQHILETSVQEVFDYNEKRHALYFHTGRKLIDGDQTEEENFPGTWISQKIVHPYFAERFQAVFFQVRKRNEKQEQDLLLKNKKQEYEWFTMTAERVDSGQRGENTLVVTLRPSTEEQNLRQQYLRVNDFYQAFLSEAIAYMEVDLEENRIERSGGVWFHYLNEMMEKEFTYQDMVDIYAAELADPSDRAAYIESLGIEKIRENYREGRTTTYLHLRRKMKEGTYRWVEMVVHVFQEQITEKMYGLVYLKDIDLKKRYHLQQEQEASRDPLTGLLNRRAFERAVVSHMDEVAAGEPCAILLFDLDGFKAINDTYGHQMGDEILQDFAEILCRSFRKTDYVGRLGGDEFMVFMYRYGSRKIISQRIEAVFEQLEKVSHFAVTSSVGIDVFQGRDFSYEDSLRRADEALYESKHRGKRAYSWWENGLNFPTA